MTKQEKWFIKNQIERLRKRKETLVDEFIGACEEVNKEIKFYKEQLKEQTNDTYK